MSTNKAKLPRGWTTVRVDRVGAVRLGRQRSPDKHTGQHPTKYLRAANIKPAGIDLTDVLTMDFTPSERVIFGLRHGDILLTEASGSSSQVGRAALWRGELAECCYQNTIIRFRPHAVAPEYALTVFRHYVASGAFARLARGVGIQHLGASRFAGLAFPLPPLKEQTRIARAVEERLGEIRDAESHLRSALDHLDAQRKEILAAAAHGELVASPRSAAEGAEEAAKTRKKITPRTSGPQDSLFDLGDGSRTEAGSPPLPSGWISVRVDEAGTARLGRQRSPEHHRGEHLRPYLRVANVLEDRIDTTEVYEMNFAPDEYKSYMLEHGDILLNEGQSLELVGRPAMFRDQVPGACFQNHLIRFRAGAAVDPEFALLVFLHYLHSGKFRSLARGSTNIANLGLERFRSMPFPVPPLKEQKVIVKEARQRMDVVSAQVTAVRSSMDRLPEMERELLAAAVAGELVEQDPSDESADELLARLGEPTEAAVAPSMTKKEKRGGAMKKKTSPSPSIARAPKLGEVLKKAGRPLALPELFALAGFDRDEPEHVELFYLALRSELNHTIRQVGRNTENAMLEEIDDAA
ncbi:restriction endonuclease subunit S [Ralstonia pseudosolanacearum]|uniref:restriction endonuclease subunit S n=1 Tax=Ralstonia pseudosolanacearum TaxID=1310165 RepID=UPI001FFC0288|nr:restriction endonuclease subunit S [Ralstonia pseudosolanacearum]